MWIFQVSALSGVSPKISENLLRRLRTARKVFTDSIAELYEAKGLGRAKAEMNREAT